MYCLAQSGRPADGARVGEDVLAARIRLLGPDHPDTLDTRVIVVRCYGLAGELKRAIQATEALLNDLIRVLGADDPQTFTARKRPRDLVRRRRQRGGGGCRVSSAYSAIASARSGGTTRTP
jgi:hypothetical protein